MKQLWNSFLRTVFRSVNSFLSAANGFMHHRGIVLAVVIAVAAAVTLRTGELYGSTGEAVPVYAGLPEQSEGSETELEQTKEETEAAAEKTKRNIGPGYETRAQLQTEPSQEETTEETREAGENAEEKQRLEESTEEKQEKEKAGENGQTEETTGGESKPEDSAAKTAGTGEAALPVSCTEQEYRILQRIVQAEAGDGDVKGRILVANVVLNRVHAAEFPDTIAGVVYQKNQFSPVNDGTFNSCRVTPETTEAVNRALAGEDYSQGALYFMNRRGASRKNVRWFDSHLTYLFQYGGHEFFK